MSQSSGFTPHRVVVSIRMFAVIFVTDLGYWNRFDDFESIHRNSRQKSCSACVICLVLTLALEGEEGKAFEMIVRPLVGYVTYLVKD